MMLWCRYCEKYGLTVADSLISIRHPTCQMLDPLTDLFQ